MHQSVMLHNFGANISVRHFLKLYNVYSSYIDLSKYKLDVVAPLVTDHPSKNFTSLKLTSVFANHLINIASKI